MPWTRLGRSLLLALAFLAAVPTLLRMASRHIFRLATRFQGEQILLPACLGFAFLLAWMGTRAGLAPIVGAYAAGLTLERTHVRIMEEREFHRLEDLVHPLVAVLSPLFFVLMGARVDPGAFLAPSILLLTLALALLGTAGKLLSGLAAGSGLRRAVVGWGMVPRGEVGLIFVAAGSQLDLGGRPLLASATQAAVVGAILLTTLAGPLGLALSLRRTP
jgi:Kef-type K+ transport system membrane component KefB